MARFPDAMAKRLATAAVMVVAALGGAFAQSSPGAEDAPVFVGSSGLVVTRPVETALSRLREITRDWVAAESAGRVEAASALRGELLASAQQIGFQRLPDAAAAAGLLAARAAARRDHAAVARALAAAEDFDPGTAQNSFAGARAARAGGRWLDAWRLDAQGLSRTLRQRPLAALARQNLIVGTLLVAVLAGVLFVVLQAMTRGRRVVDKLRAFFGSTVPSPVASALAMLLLFWPLLLPAGALWLAAYWAVLLWTGARATERLVLATFLFLVCFVPVARERLERRWAVDASAAVRGLDHLAAERLSGSFLADLAALDQSLPREPAARQVLADVYRRLGQWEEARALYGALVEADPDNVAAILGLGAHASAKGDFRRAVEWFRKASEVDAQSAEAFFNLSQAYNSSYLFDDSRRALEAARAIDERRVSRWIGGSEPRAWVVPEAVVERRAELLSLLREARRPPAPGVPAWLLSLAAWLVLLLLAAAAEQASRRRPSRSATPETPLGYRPLVASSWARALVPGLGSIEDGHGLRGFFSLVPFAVCCLVLGANRWLHRLPTAAVGGSSLIVALAIAALLAWYGLRMAWLRWRDE